MAAPSLDNEFMKYWEKLSVVQKESLISVAKNYAELTGVEDMGDARKKLILAERDAYLKGGEIRYGWDQVKEMAYNKDKRNGL
jgi:hypothetical protein